MRSFFHTLLLGAFFLAPFNTIRLQGEISYTFSDLLLTIALLIVFISALKNEVRIYISTYWYIWFFGAFLIVTGLLLSDVIREVPIDRTIANLSQYTFTYIIIPILILLTKEDERIYFAIAFALGLYFVIAIGAITYIFTPEIYSNFVDKGIFIMKSRMGSFIGPNGLAKTIALLTPTILYLYFKGNKKLFVYNGLVLFIVGLLLSGSFGGLIGTIVGIVLFYSLLFSKTWNKTNIRRYLIRASISIAIFVTVIFTVLIILYEKGYSILPQRILKVFETRNISEAGSIITKLELMKEALSIISSNPFVGIGSHQYIKYSIFGEQVHNTYLLLWTEGGIIAFCGILIIAFITIIKGILTYLHSRSQDEIIISILLLSSSIVWAVNMFTNTSSYARYEVLPIIFVMAFTTNSKQNKNVR